MSETALLGQKNEDGQDEGEAAGARIDNAEAGGLAIPAEQERLPEWAELPADLIIPSGIVVGFLRVRAAWTVRPDLGDRTAVVWPLTDVDERLALSRCQDNPYTAINEQTIQMIRAVDGVRVDWAAKSGDPGNIRDFWREIGPKGRQVLQRYYNQTHNLTIGETADFLESCVAVRTMT
jgi:hypothetical protein